MADQAALFHERDDRNFMDDGAPCTPWQRAVIAEWHRRNPNPVCLTYGPITVRCVAYGAYCACCGTPGVAIPADYSPNNSAAENSADFICPQCTRAAMAATP